MSVSRSRQPARLRPWLLPLFTLFVAWLCFFWRFAAPQPADRLTYPNGDFTQQFGVFRDVAYRALLTGNLPLWAECLNSGYPFYADPQAQLWYPPAWLTMAVLRLGGWGHFPIEALVAETLLHYLVLSYSLLFFLGSGLGLRPWAAALGALVFTYGGYLTGSPPLQTATLNTNTWLPLALWCAGQWATTRQIRWLAVLAPVLAIAFFAGHPQTFVYVAGLTLAYFAYRARRAQWSFWPIGLALVSTIGLVVITAAIQLLPSAHFILNSTRATLDYAAASRGFPLPDVLQFFLTGFVSYWHPLYVGWLPLALAGFACLRRFPEIYFWSAAALLALLLSFGSKVAAYDFAYWLIPGFGLFRGQEHLALIVSFALAVLAAYGAHWLLGPLTPRARHALAQGLRVALWALGLALAVLALLTYLARLGYDPSDWKNVPDRAGVMLLAAGLTVLALGLRHQAPALRRLWPLILVSCALLDVFAANRPLNVVPVFATYPNTPLVEPLLADKSFFRVQDEYQLPGHAGCGYGFRAIDGITPYQIGTYSRFLAAAPDAVRWSVLGVRYLVTWRQYVDNTEVVAEAPSAPGAPNQAGLTRVYRFTHITAQRAFLVYDVWPIAEPQQLAAALQDPAFQPETMVILPEAIATEPGQGSVQVLVDTPGYLQLQATTTTPAVLVVSEAFFPGWQAEVNGVATPVLLADGVALGIPLAAGEHTLTVAFRPAPLLWGAISSLLGLVSCVGVFFWRVAKKPIAKP